MAEHAERAAVVDAAREMDRLGLNRGTSGNLSARRGDGGGIWLTPSSVPTDRLTPASVVSLDWDGAWRGEAGLSPSSEWRMHRDLLAARDDLGALAHAHPVAATGLAVHGRAIPAFHYMVAVAGGTSIPCAGYATFGTQALSDAVLAALEGRRACLMAHHGMVAGGASPAGAVALALEVETLAAQYIAALAIGEPPLLTEAEMAEVRARFAAGPGYGATEG